MGMRYLSLDRPRLLSFFPQDLVVLIDLLKAPGILLAGPQRRSDAQSSPVLGLDLPDVLIRSTELLIIRIKLRLEDLLPDHVLPSRNQGNEPLEAVVRLAGHMRTVNVWTPLERHFHKGGHHFGLVREGKGALRVM